MAEADFTGIKKKVKIEFIEFSADTLVPSLTIEHSCIYGSCVPAAILKADV